MKKFLIFFSLIFLFSCGNTDTTNIEIKAFTNKKTAIFFMENVLDIEKVKPLLHEDFNFTFMGNTIISKKPTILKVGLTNGMEKSFRLYCRME